MIYDKDYTKDVANVLLKESKLKDSNNKLVCTLLMMDTEYAANDHSDSNQLPEKTFVRQKEEMIEVVLKHPGVFLPFIAADPRRIKANKKKEKEEEEKKKRRKKIKATHGIKYITNALEKEGFFGVKIYPPLGYEPDDVSLRPLYKYCEQNEIPITAHCLYGGFYSAQDISKKIREKYKKKKFYYWGLANPVNWKPVLDRHPNLKLNLGHFGGDIFGKNILGIKDKDQIKIEKEVYNGNR